MSTAELTNGVCADHDPETPTERDHDPVGVLNLGLVQKHGRHDTISEQDQERRPDRLSTEDAQGSSSRGTKLAPRHYPSPFDNVKRSSQTAVYRFAMIRSA